MSRTWKSLIIIIAITSVSYALAISINGQEIHDGAWFIMFVSGAASYGVADWGTE